MIHLPSCAQAEQLSSEQMGISAYCVLETTLSYFIEDYAADCLKILKHLHARGSIVMMITVSEDLNIAGKQ